MDGTQGRAGGFLLGGGLRAARISFLLLAAAPPVSACEPAFELLRFRASKALLLSGEVTLEARGQAADAAAAELRSCRDGAAVAPAADCVVVLDAVTEATLHHSQEVTWIDPADQGVLQTMAGRRGRRLRTIRATADGHHQWTVRPKDKKQGKRAVDRWTKRTEKHVAWPAREEVRPRSSSFGLLYQAAALRLDREGARAVLHVHSKGRLLEVTLTAKELVGVELDLARGEGGVVRRVKGERLLRRVLVEGDAADGRQDESPVGLLGMSSGIELYLEPGTGLPMEVRGRVPKIGALRVRLVEARLR